MAPTFRTCAACGTRNNPKWEFCVRCGDALVQDEGAPLGVVDDELAPAAPEPARFPWRALLVPAACAAVVAAVFTVEPGQVRRLPLLAPPAKDPPAAPAPPATLVAPGMARYSEGLVLVANRQHAKAVGPLSDALAAQPANPDVQLAYARALWGSGSVAEALSRFEEAARLGGGAFRMEYANALLQAGRTADASRVLEEAVKADPQRLEALETLGRLYNREGRTAEAAAVLSRAVELSANDPQLVAHLGYALERSGNAEKAAEVLAGLVASVPASTIARELLAEAEFKQGKRDEAVAVVRQGLEQKPDSPDLLRRLGSLLERSGRPGEAAAAYRDYLRLAPQAGDAQALAERAAYLERTSGSSGGAS